MSDAMITPQLLRWARERSGIPTERIVKRANIDLPRLTSWENGEDRPTFRQAQILAHILHIPFGYLFLSDPPKETPQIPDFRLTVDSSHHTYSADFLEVLHSAMRKQQWYREFLIEDGSSPLSFIGKYNRTANPADVALDIRNILDVPLHRAQKCTTWDEYLRILTRSADAAGIIVLRSGVVGSNTHRKLSVEEFRGFALSDDMAPLIFINGSDAKTAQIFTLLHELAHLWIGESGISDIITTIPSKDVAHEVERFCDTTATEFLVPESDFSSQWDTNATAIEEVERLSRHYRVSTVVILRRAFELDFIGSQTFVSLLEIVKGKQKSVKSEKPGGDFYATLQVRNGYNLTSTIVGAALEGRILYRQAAELLDVHPSKISDIAEHFGMR